MKKKIYHHFILIIILFIQSLCQAFSSSLPYYDEDIKNIQKYIHQQKLNTIAEKIDVISQKWLNKPYLLYALGEGHNALYDQHPLYRTDAFDCETFVDTTLALAFSNDIKSFKKNINNIRYIHGKPNFLERNHFISLDWNPNNETKGYIKNFTPNMSYISKATTTIDKAKWFNFLKKDRLYLPRATPQEIQKRYEILIAKGQSFTPKKVSIDYVPLNKLFNTKQEPNLKEFAKIPHGAIIQIVRPNWDLRQKIGTSMHVSHLGFAIKKNNILWFRNASSIHHKVIDEPLIDYLKKCLSSPTIKGIHIEIVNESIYE